MLARTGVPIARVAAVLQANVVDRDGTARLAHAISDRVALLATAANDFPDRAATVPRAGLIVDHDAAAAGHAGTTSASAVRRPRRSLRSTFSLCLKKKGSIRWPAKLR